mmetsp:Transcript_30160/g.44047  ORF Transcript_30160/g.44047 Transcript_30160/m.44047 type:complete len:84 (+) Transcript_30160:825-1076(+)
MSFLILSRKKENYWKLGRMSTNVYGLMLGNSTNRRYAKQLKNLLQRDSYIQPSMRTTTSMRCNILQTDEWGWFVSIALPLMDK